MYFFLTHGLHRHSSSSKMSKTDQKLDLKRMQDEGKEIWVDLHNYYTTNNTSDSESAHLQHDIENLQKFLLLKVLCEDFNATKLSPPSLHVDTMWHDFILHTKLYKKFCDEVVTQTIHHDPRGSQDVVARQARYCGHVYVYDYVEYLMFITRIENTLKLWKGTFGESFQEAPRRTNPQNKRKNEEISKETEEEVEAVKPEKPV